MRAYRRDGTGAVDDVGNDGYATLINVTGPANALNQRFRQDYVFDDQVHQFIVKVTNSYGYSSQTTYDLRFGHPLSTVDLNNNTIQYHLNTLSRPTPVPRPSDLSPT